MKKLVYFLFVLLLNQSLSAQGNEEFRATWIVDSQWLSPTNSVEENQALTREILDNHKKANMTSVLWQVRRFGSVYYPSTIEPWGPQAGFQNPGYDPLAYAIEQAHARGLEFHAWFNTFESRYAYAGSPSQQHPEWICRDQDGNVMPADIAWLSPGLEEVREYLKEVALEIVRNYDIDGLHLDFVRWNEHTSSGLAPALAKENLQKQLPDGFISEAQLKELANNAAGRYLYDPEHPFSAGVPAGFGSWEEWWRGTVTEFVSALHDSIQALKPWVRLSPAALGRYNWGGWQGFDVVYQDAALWLNEGYIDQLVGMHYHWDQPGDIYNVLEGGCPQCWSQFIQPAIQDGRLYSVGLFSDNFAEDNVFSHHRAIVDTVRTVSWADGFQFFSYKSWQDERYWEEARSLFFPQKTKIRATKLIDDSPPDAPALELNKLDSLNYQITISPAPLLQENLWFAVYRSTDNAPDPDSDEIIEVFFRDSQFSYTDSFSGLQDYDGSYWYFATALDRFWNESSASNAALSDPIPSFAPTVAASFPSAGDTIPVNSRIEITFSKTIDIASAENALSFAPSLAVGQLSWSTDYKTLTVEAAGNFAFDTEYTLTISPVVKDVNGRPLDGNGDGSSGDAFNLTFRTLPEDRTGPKIVYSFPDMQLPEEDFTIDEVITFQFDEIVEEASVSPGSIFFRKDGVDVPFDFLLTTVENSSVLSIQSLDPLENRQDYTVTLSPAITDTLGNPLPGEVNVTFGTSVLHYKETEWIDRFSILPQNWWQPDGSGSTIGTVVSGTSFGFGSNVTLPAPRPIKAAFLRYEWDVSAGDWLIREYLAGGAPRNVLFDSSYVLQCYVFGDGSRNQFRFAIDDNVPATAAVNHEVSHWITLDWVGWRIVEWDLSDPNSVGEWIGNGVVEGTLRFDSFQLTHDPAAAVSGRIYFDDLRLVKKTDQPVPVTVTDNPIPGSFRLYQNYPNPFNPSTAIAFDLPESGPVKLVIYDMLGREVETLLQEKKQAGHYTVQFNAGSLASGIYIYRLSLNNRTISKRMLLLK